MLSETTFIKANKIFKCTLSPGKYLFHPKQTKLAPTKKKKRRRRKREFTDHYSKMSHHKAL